MSTTTATPAPVLVEVYRHSGETQDADWPLFNGVPSDAYRTLKPGIYYGTGTADAELDEETEDIVLVVNETSSTALWWKRYILAITYRGGDLEVRTFDDEAEAFDAFRTQTGNARVRDAEVTGAEIALTSWAR